MTFSYHFPRSEVVAWLRSHEFVDVNVPVRVAKATGGNMFVVTFDRDFGITPLMAACSLLDVKMASCLLEHGSCVALRTGNGDTALHFVWKRWAANESELTATASMKNVAELALKAQRVLEVLELLAAQGFDVNAQVRSYGALSTLYGFSVQLRVTECVRRNLNSVLRAIWARRVRQAASCPRRGSVRSRSSREIGSAVRSRAYARRSTPNTAQLRSH